MDPKLEAKIKNKLRKFLKREPQPHEVMNSQNDSLVMVWILMDDMEALKAEVELLKKSDT